jgi:hypothetical protein
VVVVAFAALLSLERVQGLTISISPCNGSGVTATFAPGNSWPSSCSGSNSAQLQSGTDIAVVINNSSPVTISISGLTSDSIGALTINATSSGGVTVDIGSGPTGYLTNIGSIDTTAGTASVVFSGIRASGTIGHVDTVDIERLAALGGVDGHITCAPASAGQQSRIEFVSAGYLHGDVVAESGTILDVAVSGNVGADSAHPISIRAYDKVGRVYGEEVHANISGPTGSEDTVLVGRVEAWGGVIDGSMRMAHFDGSTYGGSAPGIYTTSGDMAANVTIAGDMTVTQSDPAQRPMILLNTGSTYLTGTFVIGGKLIGADGSIGTNYAFDLPYHGLTGQIIINANGTYDPAVTHVWTSPIHFAGSGGDPAFTLDESSSSPDTAPYYTRAAVDLGGGSVGVVGYHLQDADCNPVNGTDGACPMPTRWWPVDSGTQERQTIVLSFKGPLLNTVPNGSVKPVILSQQDMTCGSPCRRRGWSSPARR